MTKNKLLVALGLAGFAVGMARRRRNTYGGPATGLGAGGRPGTAVITGGSAGIGAAFARQLAARGYDLLLVARRSARLAAIADELRSRHGVAVDTLTADLADAADVDRVVARFQELPDLTLLVNNAGFGHTDKFAMADAGRVLDMIDVHIVASVRLARAALPGMIARRHGGIINLASLAAFVPLPGSATYSATKAYLVMFSEALQHELAGTGVRVQALCPGFTHTEFHDAAGLGADPRSGIPEFMWMPADAVVADSLAALHRGGVICVPGLGNQIIAGLARTMPTSNLIRAAMRFAP